MLDNIAKEISQLDFSEVQNDNTDEAIILLAQDLYNLSDEESEKVLNIIMKKYIQEIK